jgi:mRNA-degrading endonuclease toxin of MazEF toxin-antitoxin module
MIIRQWEIWKSKPAGFKREHWFVIITPQERLNSVRHQQINGLACFTLRGAPLPTDVRLNHADGFEHATVCQCDLIYFLDKSNLRSRLGIVTWERQQQVKSKFKEVFRF